MDAGETDERIEAQLRSRRWQRFYDGVFCTFTGPLPWLSRAWAALLVAGPEAVLCGESCLSAAGMRREYSTDVIHVCVPHDRHPEVPPGVVVTRRRHLHRLSHPSASLPRLRFEVAVLETQANSKARGGRSASSQMRASSDSPLPRSFSTLCQYLRRVERPHCLPTAARQRRVVIARTPAYRDVDYVGYGKVCELDGRLGHEPDYDRSNDRDRDNRAADAEAVTLRFRYRQVLDASCETAGIVAGAFRRRGWRGRLRRCGPDCRL